MTNIGSTNVDEVMQFTDGMQYSPIVLKNNGLKRLCYSEGAKSTRNAPFVNRVKIELRRNPNFPIPNTWLAGMGRATRKCNLCEELLSRKPNSLNKLYRGRAP